MDLLDSIVSVSSNLMFLDHIVSSHPCNFNLRLDETIEWIKQFGEKDTACFQKTLFQAIAPLYNLFNNFMGIISDGLEFWNCDFLQESFFVEDYLYYYPWNFWEKCWANERNKSKRNDKSNPPTNCCSLSRIRRAIDLPQKLHFLQQPQAVKNLCTWGTRGTKHCYYSFRK